MKIENWLYFRTVTDEDDDDGEQSGVITAPTSLCLPASSIQQITPQDDTHVRISFESIALDDHAQSGRGSRPLGRDHVTLVTAQGKTAEVVKALAEAIAGTSKNNDGFIVIADDVTTNTANKGVAARYLNPNITGCSAINVYKTEQGIGMHEYYESVIPATADDDDVAASLSISLPAQCILLEASISCFVLATSADASVALEFHSAAIADDAASGGTEWVGADTLNLTQVEDNDDYGGTGNTGDATSIPNANLNIGSGDVINDGVHSGVADPIDRGAAATFFHVTAKEDLSSMTGNPRIGVYVRWWGGPAVALNA